ncbi:MAG: MFS transporter [Planctomycetota bacterium]|nr:MFS transporter [Planctomycetota bacterium]
MPYKSSDRRAITGLGLLFGAMYFVQGIGEPTEGLVGQPVKSFLKTNGYSAAEITSFSALLALPWAIKPLYGLLTDFVPLFGLRRRSYLLLATVATTAGLLGLFATFTPGISRASLLAALLIPSIGIAFSDVVIDALMVENGQRHGATGRFQSIQWAALYGAAILAGPIGGYLAAHKRQEFGFLICGIAAGVSLILTWVFVRERPMPSERRGARAAWLTLRQAAATPGLAAVAGFLFLWNFNPFANDVLYLHLTEGIGLDEEFYGWTVSLMGVASVAASIAYGVYCNRVPFGVLLHLSIAFGVISTACYGFVVGPKTAVAVTLLVGFTYMTAVLIQLDLAARACPPEVAGTAFALLMSVTNISLSMAIAFGGNLYDRWTASWDAQTAFRMLVALGTAFSIGCWAFVPFLRRHVASIESSQAANPAE